MFGDAARTARKTKEQKRYGLILPYNQKDEFPSIRRNLRRRGVEWFECKISNERNVKVSRKCSTVIFWVFESELHKLPVDNNADSKTKQYFEVYKEDGHGIYPIDKTLNAFRKDKDTTVGLDIKHPLRRKNEKYA